ncbi:MAG: efflux RND transporter permease subunit [Pseudomonadota bacterium]
MSPATYAIENKLISWVVVLLAVVGGSLAYVNMPRFEDPEFLIRTAQVITDYPGATPREVAEEVADVLETELQGLQEVDEIRSTSYDGLSIISVDIKHAFSGTKPALQSAFSRVRNRVQDARASLPPGAGEPIVNDDFGDVYGLYYLITGPGFSIAELEDYAERLRTDLLTVDGVAKVELTGGQSEAIYVEVARDRAAALGVSLSTVFADLAAQNSVQSAGRVRADGARVYIHPTGEVDSVDAIAGTVVSTSQVSAQGADLVYLRDVATVQRGYVEPAFSVVRYNGQRAIGLGISNVTGANAGKIGEEVRGKIAATLGERPYGIEVNEFYHQGDAVNESVESFALNVVAALVIVLITLFLFMGLRSAIVIGAVLLVTIAATLATMVLADIPLHRISLGALIIALGMLVDNAIVVTEGILVGVQSGQRKLDIARDIVDRTKWALLGGTAIGIIAFAPIGFAPGDTGEYTNHLFWVVFISLLYSWIFAITLAPMFSDLLFKENLDQAGGVAQDGRLTVAYKRFMRGTLKARWLVVAACVAVFVVSAGAFQFVKSGFFPASTTPQIAIDYWLPEGTAIETTAADLVKIENYLAGLDGVERVHSVAGLGGMRYMLIYQTVDPNAAFGQVLIRVDAYDKIATLIPAIQGYLETNFPAAQPRVWKFTLGPSQGSKIEAVFQGPDPRVLRELAVEARQLLQADPEARGVKTNWRQEIPVVVPRYDAERARRVGVSREDLSNALATNFSGRTIGVYREGNDLIPIISRAPARESADLESSSGIQVLSSRTGRTVPISEVTQEPSVLWRDGQLHREDRVWTLKVQADPVPGVLASSVLARVRPQIEAIELPVGYALRWDGEIGDSEEANGQLAGTLPYALLAIVLVLIFLFNGLRQPLAIWTIVPLAIVGVVVGLLATDTTLEFMAILGILSLAGLLIKNAIVLVDQMDLEIREGKPRFDAIVDSAASRVRPVMMGALTTVLGVIPLFSDIFFASMAVVIAFGLSFATVITLVVLPVIYAIYFGIGASESALKQGSA